MAPSPLEHLLLPLSGARGITRTETAYNRPQERKIYIDLEGEGPGLQKTQRKKLGSDTIVLTTLD